MKPAIFYGPRLLTSKPAKVVLVWCLVCKKWLSAYEHADACPRCGNDEIEHDQ